ncbi:dual-domain HisK/Mak2 protein kinase [Flagelloscypha sp. PMI_526]|nr:dual-domain HisK/Mak2 protein kinase [Flagelloscypha sp. PMI_526]
MAVPWRDTGSMTLLAEGNSLKDGSNVLAKIAPAQSNGSMCLEREAHILTKLISHPNTALQLIDIFHIDRENGDVLVLLLSHPGLNLLGRYFPQGQINDLLLPIYHSPPHSSISGDASTPLTAGIEGRNLEPDVENVDVMDLASFIQFAIEATHCLERVHQESLSHREIRANSFHLNAHTGLVRFVHFGNRSVSLENFGSPSSLVLRANPLEKWRVKEALCYLAPEQTGSTETVTQDHRTDLYSLGILFWTLLVGRGQLPFDGDPPELLHQIVQKRPMPPHEVRRDVPQVLASVVEKLLAKNPDHRYQSAYGVKMDLLECQQRLQAAVISSSTEAELIPAFEIGKEDRFMEFTFPLHLFGRERELELIRSVTRSVSSSFSRSMTRTLPLGSYTDASTSAGDDFSDSPSDSSNRMSATASLDFSVSRTSGEQIVLKTKLSSNAQTIVVCGPPGVGKSSLVVHTQASWRSHGLWGQAKFQRTESAPFAAMLTCLSSVLRQLQVFPASLDTFVNLLKERLGPQLHNVPLLYEGAPELRDVLAQFNIVLNSPQELLDTPELRTRFQVLVENVFSVIAETRLFALFLDDIHEADESTMDLVSTLVNSKSGMLLLLLPAHSLGSDRVARMRTMFSARSRPTWLDVEALDFSAILSMVSMALHRRQDECENLAQFIQMMTSGNAFAARNILTTLQRQKMITFDWESNVWRFNMNTIETSFGSEVVSSDPNDLRFLLVRLRELPSDARKYLLWASQFGQTFKVTDVSLMMDWDTRRDGGEDESGSHSTVDFLRVKTDVSEGITHGRSSMRGLQTVLAEGWLVQRARDMCSFSHDRYRQAAQAEAASLPLEDVAKMSFRIILMTLHEAIPDIYRIAEHAKKCLHLLRSHTKREDFLSALIEAGESAWARGAHELAIVTFQNARELLPTTPWQTSPHRTFSLLTKLAELLTWEGSYDESDVIIEECFSHANSREDRSMMLRLRSQNHWRRNNFPQALDDILSALRLLGVEIDLSLSQNEADEMFEQVKQEMLAKGSEEILNLPRANDPKVELAFTLLNDAGTYAHWNPASSHMVGIIGLTTIQLALKSGIAAGTAMGFFWTLGAAAERHGFLRFSHELGEMGLRIAEITGRSAEKCRARVLRCTLVSAYTNVHLRANIPTLEEAIQYGQSAGDRAFTALARIHLIEARLYVCEHLSELVTQAEECLNDIQATVPGTSVAIPAQAVLNCLRALGGYTSGSTPETVFDTPTFSEQRYLEEITANSGNEKLTVSWYTAFKIPALYCLGHYLKAVELGFDVYAHRNLHSNHRHVRYALFFHSLALLATFRTVKLSKPIRKKYLEQVQLNQTFIKKWQHSAPVNTNTWVTLVDAELAALKDPLSATKLFDEAVTYAVNNEWHLEEACALYLQGCHFVRIGVRSLGRELQDRAMARFGQFGARGAIQWIASEIGSASPTPLKRPILSSDIGVQTDPPIFTPLGDTTDDVSAEEREQTLSAADFSQILKWSKDISRDINLSSALQRLTEIVTETSQSQTTSIVVTRDHGDYTVATTHNPPELCQVYNQPRPIRLISDPLQRAIIGHTLNNKETYAGDASLDSRFSSEAGQSPYTFVICLPIFSNRGQTFGTCYMASSHPFSEKALAVLTLLCQQASISISNALLFRSVQAGTKENLKMIATQREALEDARKSREDALKATKIKSNFLASMSHELRTPFSSFYGFLDLLDGTDLNPGQEELVQTAKQSCELLLKIIDSILDYSKLEASAVTIESTPFAMEDMIADCMELLLPMAAKKLDLSFNIQPEVPPWVAGDYARIRQVLMNLIGNAVKFTERGNVNVVVSIDSTTDGGDLTKFEITDTGIGIADVEQLFKPFQQADNSTTRQFGGTGLGLSISRELVELMRGSIGLESHLGVGSKFWFKIPLSKYDGIESKKALATLETLRGNLLRTRRRWGIICSKSDLTRSLLQNLLNGMELASISSMEEIETRISLLPPNQVLDFLIIDEQSEVAVDKLCQSVRTSVNPSLKDTKIIHFFTPTTDRKFIRNAPGVIKMTKPPRSLKLLQTLSSKDSDNIGDGSVFRSDMKRPEPLPRRTLYGNLLIKQLTKFSLNVVPTNNGEAAIQEWQAHEPGYFSVALFDHRQQAKRLRQLELKLHAPVTLPIVALSADAQESTKKLCLSAGMNAFFTKPLKRNDLTQLLSTYGPHPPATQPSST